MSAAEGIRISYECGEKGGPTYAVWMPLDRGLSEPLTWPAAFRWAVLDAANSLVGAVARDLERAHFEDESLG